MTTNNKAAMLFHDTSDWCHLCGSRKAPTVDIWYPDNAEHDSAVAPGPQHSGRHYIRICGACAHRIQDIAQNKEI